MSRGLPNATHKQTCNAATTATNQHQLRNTRTQTEIQLGKQDPQSMGTTVPDTNPVTTKETTPDTPAQTQADADKNNKNCRDPGSNRGPSDLQSDALPAELSRPLGKQPPSTQAASRAHKRPSANNHAPRDARTPDLEVNGSTP